ncbi:uncharacterized protein K02A2.6-like [Gigantopelta aegis]|uniref:uncharacterized protein K02A2.6-like n=1 Tax=Gigantopelta aegis TaxID=1735272 RepID=UPI001B88AE24|nr:uncharacterized protein K02A2.6-like [Gigantopelta aegis]
MTTGVQNLPSPNEWGWNKKVDGGWEPSWTTLPEASEALSPQKPSEKTFDELVKLVQEHHQPPPSVTVQRFAFHSRTRKEGKSIANFVAHLRELLEHCQFGDTLNDMLRDRLICGCYSCERIWTKSPWKRLVTQDKTQLGKKLHLNYLRPKALKLEDVLNRHNVLFKDELGLVQSTQAKLHVDPQSQPKYFRPRPIPYALRGKVEQELERLEKAGIIEPVEFSEWAAPVVPVIKWDGTVRICGDYKLTVNQAAKLDTYPLPKVDDLFSQLAGGKKFTKLDLAHAYQQIALEPDSKQYLTINTHKGLYQYTRLPFGVHSAPSNLSTDNRRHFERCQERAVLSHIMEDGSEKPVAFASRSLTPAEKRYSQLDKEALAIIFTWSEERQQEFNVGALALSAYEYNIVYKSGNSNANADLLSRLPLPETIADVPIPGELILLMETIQSSPITSTKIKSWTDKDPILARVRNCTLKGWTKTSAEDLRPFSQRKEELSVQDGCILLGCRVVIPKVGREKLLDQLHETHPGIVRMKSLARSTVWWPGIDKQIEEKVKSCQQCQSNQKSLAAVPMHPWEWPKRPWARIHIDHAGPFQGKIFLVVIDAHSKWLEVVVVPSTSSINTIRVLRTMFATHGLPEVVVTDNGTAFTSGEFQEFLKKNGIQHLRSAPYHPSSNGLAERGVQILKEGLKKITNGDIETRLARLLYHYRITPHSTTGVSPAEL